MLVAPTLMRYQPHSLVLSDEGIYVFFATCAGGTVTGHPDTRFVNTTQMSLLPRLAGLSNIASTSRRCDGLDLLVVDGMYDGAAVAAVAIRPPPALHLRLRHPWVSVRTHPCMFAYAMYTVIPSRKDAQLTDHDEVGFAKRCSIEYARIVPHADGNFIC